MEKLFADFSSVSPQDWKTAIEKDLKGVPFEKIKWKTEDGIVLEPFYSESSSRESELFRSDRSWSITEVISDSGDIEKITPQVKQALTSGADSVLLHSYSFGGAKSGIEIENGKDLERFLNSFDLTSHKVFLSLGTRAPALLAECPSASKNSNFFTDFDPFGTALLCGEITEEKDQDWKAQLANLATGKHIAIHSSYLRESGATVIEELAFAISWYAEYLTILQDKGISLEKSLDSIWFWTGTGTDYFQEIAKLRALILLISQVAEAFGQKNPRPAFIHSSNLAFHQTVFDPHVNLLRNTTASMSAVLGGANSVSVLNYDSNHPKKDPNASRIARNTQLLLKNESYLDKVIDPSLGSYYIESLTNTIAEKAWTEFQATEAKGGFFQILSSGELQKTIQASALKKFENISAKKTILLGTNQFAQSKERISGLSPLLLEDASRKQFSKKTTFERILPSRASEEFDSIRNLTEIYFSKSGKLPKVCLLPIGDLTMRKARSAFSNNVISCLGYEIIDHNGFEKLEGVSAYLESHSPAVIVLCSSDEEYNTLVSEVAKILSSLKTKPVFVLAGYPTEKVKEFEAAGVQEFIHLKRNLIESLGSLQKRVGLIT